MSRNGVKEPEVRNVREAADAARFLGFFLILLGCLPVLVLFTAVRSVRGFTAQMLAFANAAAIVGPGVWYVIASRMIRRNDALAARRSLWVVAAQLGVVAVLLLLGFGMRLEAAALPACLMVFFVPAAVAMAYQLNRALRAMRVTGAVGRAFEPLRVLPILSPKDGAAGHDGARSDEGPREA
jgi:hypothetical protein